MDKKNQFQFLTYGGFYIKTSRDFHILIDPYLDENPNINISSDSFERIDLIIVSHGPFDHLGDTAKIAKKHGCKVICPDDVKWKLILDDKIDPKQIIGMCWGLVTKIGAIQIKAIENHHRSTIRLNSGDFVVGFPNCYIITLEDGTRVYNSGDTAIFSDMKLQGELYRPHIGLVNVTGDFVLDPDYCCAEMSAYEAALATQWLGLKVVLPCHYVKYDDQDMDAGLAEYLEIMNHINANRTEPITTVALKPGDFFEYSATEGGEL